MKKRSPAAGIITAVITVIVIGAAAAALFIFAGKPKSDRVIKVTEVTGIVNIERTDEGDLAASSGMQLENEDVLSAYDGTICFDMDQDKHLFMEPMSVLSVNATGDGSIGKTRLILKSGSLLTEMDAPISAESSFGADVPKGTIAAKEASFYIRVSDAGGGSYLTSVTVFSGSADVSLLDADGNRTGRTAAVNAGRGVYIRTDPSSTGNDAAADGISHFIIPDGESYITLEESTNPTTAAKYADIPADVLERVLASHSSGKITLGESVLREINDLTAPEETETETVTEESVTNAVTTTATPPPSTTTTSLTTEESEESSTVSQSSTSNTSATTKATTKAVTTTPYTAKVTTVTVPVYTTVPPVVTTVMTTTVLTTVPTQRSTVSTGTSPYWTRPATTTTRPNTTKPVTATTTRVTTVTTTVPTTTTVKTTTTKVTAAKTQTTTTAKTTVQTAATTKATTAPSYHGPSSGYYTGTTGKRPASGGKTDPPSGGNTGSDPSTGGDSGSGTGSDPSTGGDSGSGTGSDPSTG
ncbi:MAG: hypothetical protein J6F31_01330, partial [Oscillospiraceae bacterium]|nr:hypothetical protein [Oscillospiraceae bacterium]